MYKNCLHGLKIYGSNLNSKILAIITIILLFTVNVHWKTIISDIDPDIVKIIYTVNLVMTMVISTLMITGALKRSTAMMLPWVVLGIILLGGLFVSVLYTSISLFFNDDELHHMLYGALFLIFGLLVLYIYLYFWFVVYSYFQQLRTEKNTIKIGPYGRPYLYQRP
ncbi:uncharacterized protein LOC131663324 [Phymastichus coffea]|uniref:uncharacterized protein LOC131663324 n=1 Tax=Phymastichus coffea TaxID=108790 RepID=UPI00273BC944|nr:uncharacterized protein LOC131663324 [Phymastichus coffea]